jgi:DNA-binding transcriptional LysR family regulator
MDQFSLKQSFLGELHERLANETLDVALVPSGFFDSRYQRCPFYADTLQFLAAETGARSAVPPVGISLREAAESTLILTADGCGLSPLIRRLFRRNRLPIRSYPGLALDHPVVEEWVALGLGCGLLPKLKLTSQKSRARPLLLKGKPVPVTYELVWLKKSSAAPHVTALIQHFRDVVPKLIAGRA